MPVWRFDSIAMPDAADSSSVDVRQQPCLGGRWRSALPTALVALCMVAMTPATGTAAALASDPFATDPQFWGGQYRPDNFGQPAHHGHLIGQKVIKLGNDLVVAGLVPPSAGAPNLTRNLGLARYDVNGFHTGWQALIYPNTTSASYTQVRDLASDGQRLFVLIDHINTTFSDPDVRLLVFDATGQLTQNLGVLVGFDEEFGGGIALYQYPGLTTRLAVSGTTWVNGKARPTYRSYSLSNGQLSADGPPILISAGPCVANQSCIATAIAVTGGAGSIEPRIYLAGSFLWQGPPASDYFTIRLDRHGGVDGSFGASGFSHVGFDEPDSSNQDVLTALAVRNVGTLTVPDDQILLIGDVARRCQTGIGVAQLNHDGSLESGFANSGRQIVGGSAASGLLCLTGSRDTAAAADLSEGRLLIVGQTRWPCPFPACGPREHGTLVAIDADSGALREHRDLPFYTGSTLERDSALTGVVRFDNVGRYVAVGRARYPDDFVNPTLAGKLRYATVGLRADRIFGQGFQID